MKALFAYGTLMCRDIIEAVAGIVPKSVNGTAKGYRRLKVINQQYPGLVPYSEGSVDGVVYLEISPSCWNRLDLFEGEMYSRENVEIELEDKTILTAETYIVKEMYRKNLSDEDWIFENFLQKGKTAFVNSYNGYDDINS